MRAEQSRQELDLLAQEMDTWVSKRVHADRHKRHVSQLQSLRLVLETASSAIRSKLDATPTSGPVGEVYERCGEVDRRALIVRRFWQFFATKWDQHDDPELGAVLDAAGEVVWSCWAGPFRALQRASEPAPLPYVEPEPSPHATLRLRPPRELKTPDDLLSALLAKLPMPLIGIPPICVRRPWWLITIAHETGHHIAHDLLDESTAKRIRALVCAAARMPGSETDTRWTNWTHELFADAFAVASVGKAQLWAIDELELAGDRQMLVDRGAHPPALMRRALNRAILATLVGNEEADAEDDPIPAQLRDSIETCGSVARALVEEPLGEKQHDTLRALCNWRGDRFQPTGEVAKWERELLGSGPLVAQSTLASARLATAGSVAAWRSVSAEPDAMLRDQHREILRQRTIDLLAACREPGTRSSTAPSDDVVNLAVELARMLTDTQLEA